MFRMYARAGRVFLGNFPLFAFFAAIPVAIDIVIEFADVRSSSGSMVANLILYAMITLFSHRLLLSGERAAIGAMFHKKKDSPLEGPQKPFMLKLMVFWLLSAVAWGLSSWGIYQAAGEQGPEILYGVMIMGLLPAAILVYIALALFGTVLPAAAALKDAGFSIALIRGKRTFWVTLLRLVTGNGLFTLAGFGSVFSLILVMSSSMTFGLETFLSFIAGLVGLFGILLTATALCMAYEDCEQVSGAEV